MLLRADSFVAYIRAWTHNTLDTVGLLPSPPLPSPSAGLPDDARPEVLGLARLQGRLRARLRRRAAPRRHRRLLLHRHAAGHGGHAGRLISRSKGLGPY